MWRPFEPPTANSGLSPVGQGAELHRDCGVLIREIGWSVWMNCVLVRNWNGIIGMGGKSGKTWVYGMVW